MLTDTRTEQQTGQTVVEPSHNKLGLTEEDIEFIREDLFRYSRKILGYDHESALRTAQIAVESLQGSH